MVGWFFSFPPLEVTSCGHYKLMKVQESTGPSVFHVKGLHTGAVRGREVMGVPRVPHVCCAACGKAQTNRKILSSE